MRFSLALFLLVLVAVPLHTSVAEPDRTFESSGFGISVKWPEAMERVPQPASSVAAGQALLILKGKGKPQPTFNVLHLPGAFPETDPSESIVDSYRSVGLTDAVAEGSWLSPQGWPVVQISFKAGDGAAARSLVAVIPRAESHFILTFVDAKEQLAADRALFEEIIAGVSISNGDVASAGDTGLGSGTARSTPAIWIVVGIGVLFAGIVTWRLKRRGAAK